MSKIYVNEAGYVIGVFPDDSDAPDGGIEVSVMPDDSRQKWDGQKWLPLDNSLRARDEIIALEDSVTPRRLREAALTEEGKAWLQGVDDEITALRNQLAAHPTAGE